MWEVGNGRGGWGIDQLGRGGDEMRNKTIRAAVRGMDTIGVGGGDWLIGIGTYIHNQICRNLIYQGDHYIIGIHAL